MNDRASKVPTKLVHGLVLLLAFVLLMAGVGFADIQPGLAAGIVFLFSFPYLAAAIATRIAYFLYATMLLGAVAYFMLCYALGAPLTWFPLLSVPLVASLWGVGRRLQHVLDPQLAAFPRTTFRAMNITVAVFAIWALLHVFPLMDDPGLLPYVAGLTYLGYALLYLTHNLTGAHSLYTYVFCIFLAAGACFTCAAGWSVQYCWIVLLTASGLTAFVGTTHHRDRTLRWSRHYFIGFAAILVASLAFSFVRWFYVPLALALGSLVLWLAYRWLAVAVGDVRQATTNERLIPRLFLLTMQCLCAVIAALSLISPGSLDIAVPALIVGVTFAWVAWERRRDQGSYGNACVLYSAFFLAGGALGVIVALAAGVEAIWYLPCGLALFVGIWALYRRLGDSASEAAKLTLAETAAFPAFFLWYVPFLGGNSGVALLAAASGVAAPVALTKLLRERQFLSALGPALSGVLLALAQMYAPTTIPVWSVCCVGVAAGGTAFLWADASKRRIAKSAAHSAWLILTVAALILAGNISMGAMVYSLSAVGAVAILMMAWQKRRLGDRDVFGIHYPGGDVFVTLAAVIATLAVVVLAPISELSLIVSGLCLVALAVAYGVARGIGRGAWCGHATALLFALGGILVIFGLWSSAGILLGAGSVIVLVLFALAALMKQAFPKFAGSCTVAGHLTSATLACAVLLLSWSTVGPALAGPAMLYVLLYGLTPRIRDNFGLKLGLVGWLSFALMFLLAAARQTPYHQQMLWIAALGAFWLVVGYIFGRGEAEKWARPMYFGATVLVLFAAAVSLMAPRTVTGSWQVFLVSGLAIAGLYLITNEEIYVYLVTLLLSLMAYDWIKLTTTHFTQDLFLCLLAGVAVLGELGESLL
ncbi:hypothetical protein ACFL1X_13200, partial [Candidatus Hydrogenedentota bacterium]